MVVPLGPAASQKETKTARILSGCLCFAVRMLRALRRRMELFQRGLRNGGDAFNQQRRHLFGVLLEDERDFLPAYRGSSSFQQS